MRTQKEMKVARERESAEVDLSAYLDKSPTDLQERFAEWLMENVGYDPGKAKTKQEAFEEGVRLATAMRMIFQRSPENQEILESRRAGQEEKPKAKAAKTTASAPAKKGGKKAKAAVEEPVKEDEEAEAPAPKKAAKKAKKAANGPVRNKRRAPTPEEDEGDEAPF